MFGRFIRIFFRFKFDNVFLVYNVTFIVCGDVGMENVFSGKILIFGRFLLIFNKSIVKNCRLDVM